jgi:hypothetical protein
MTVEHLANHYMKKKNAAAAPDIVEDESRTPIWAVDVYKTDNIRV